MHLLEDVSSLIIATMSISTPATFRFETKVFEAGEDQASRSGVTSVQTDGCRVHPLTLIGPFVTHNAALNIKKSTPVRGKHALVYFGYGFCCIFFVAQLCQNVGGSWKMRQYH